MIRCIAFRALALSMLAGSAALAQAPTTTTAPAIPAATARQIDGWIAKLSDDNWQVRQQAQDKLVEFGELAYARLQALARETTDEEIRSRSEAAIRQIEENRLAGPSMITMRHKDTHPREVFADLARQSRAEFRTYPRMWEQREWTPLSVEFERQPFWTVMRDLCLKTGMYLQNTGGYDRRMMLTPGGGGNWMQGPSVVSGPFLIVANRIHRSNSVELTNPQAVQHEFNMQLTAFAEPKLRVVSTSYNVKIEEAEDDKGNSLLPPGPAYESMSSGNSWSWSLHARLQYPENAGRKIAKFKGSVRFRIHTRIEVVEVPDILSAKDVTKTAGGRRFTIKTVNKSGERYDVRFVIYRDGRTPQDWQQLQQSLYNGGIVQLLDDKNRNLMPQGWGSGSSGNDYMEMNYQFSRENYQEEERKVGEPVKLVCEFPVESKDINVPFEFSDLPLP